jgi:hypothetical protein
VREADLGAEVAGDRQQQDLRRQGSATSARARGEGSSPDAKFFPPDHEVPYEPGFIEPLTFRPNKGPIERLGSAAWTSPPGRGYGGDQNFSGGWFSIGVGLTWK